MLRALAKDRNERYSSAGEFLADLRAFASGDPVDPSTGAIAVARPRSPRRGWPRCRRAARRGRSAAAEQATQAMPPVAETGATEVMPAQRRRGRPSPAAVGSGAAVAEVVAQPLDPTLDDDDDEERRRKRRSYWLLGGAAVAALLIVLALFLFTRDDGADPDPSASPVTIPNLVGLTEDAGDRAALDALGLMPDFEEEASTDQSQWASSPAPSRPSATASTRAARSPCSSRPGRVSSRFPTSRA